jgi:hypothetical protein
MNMNQANLGQTSANNHAQPLTAVAVAQPHSKSKISK